MNKGRADDRIITQVCIVVDDIEKTNKNWSRVLRVPAQRIDVIFPDGIQHYTYGKEAEYRDCRVAKYQLNNLVIELIQPGNGPSPWRTFLEVNGPGVFHFCIQVDDRKEFQETLSDIGVGSPYHLGYFPDGSYSYVDTKEQLGLELSVNNRANYGNLFRGLLDGTVSPLDELK